LEEQWEKDQKKYKNDTQKKDYLEAINRALPQLQTEPDVIYAQPQLVSQIEYLAYMLRGADQRPGDDAYARLKVLTGMLDELADSVE
jgi:hypothetical protein